MKVRMPVAANSELYDYPELAALYLHDPEPRLSSDQREVYAFLVHHGIMGEMEAEKLVRFLGEERAQRLRYCLKVSSQEENKNIIAFFRRKET